MNIILNSLRILALGFMIAGTLFIIGGDIYKRIRKDAKRELHYIGGPKSNN